MYAQDSLKRLYNVKGLPKEGGIEKYRERKEKKNYYSTKGCISFQEQWFK